MEKTCQTCGAVFEPSKSKLPARDKDDLRCTECGAELISWNGGVCYSIVRCITPGQQSKS